ncbi:MAG: O-antigen ligase family protein, partial [Pseudomonadota bacterium]
LYFFRLFRGSPFYFDNTTLPKVILFLIGLNLFSFFYTWNTYYTIHAAMMNITSLLLLYFVSLHVDGYRASWLLMTAAFSGFLVSIESWLQFMDVFLIFKWAHPGIMVMGTIGNSNYLGAYLIFPLFATAGLVFLLKGKTRLIPLVLFFFIFGAFLFTRARAAWFGFFLSFPIFLLLLKKIHRISIWENLRSRPRQAATYVVVALSLVVSLWQFAPQRLHAMMGFRNVTQSTTLKLRIEKYSKASLWLFKQNPIFGTGLWSYRNSVFYAQAELNKRDANYFKDYPEPKPESVHNEYLEVFNDGGVVAAFSLALFLVILMGHGWRVIKDETLDYRDRMIAATAFSAVLAIMLAGFFFFPFRINSTLFMTVLMMGMVEGIYVRNYGLISKRDMKRSKTGLVFIPLIFIVLSGFVWFKGIKPFMSEMEHFKYKKALSRGDGKAAEKYILKAIAYDPHNSTYCLYASQVYLNLLRDFGKATDFIERAIIDYNGDITMWSVYFIKGLLKFQTGALYEAQAAFEKALYYNPTFEEARQKLEEVKKVVKDHDRVVVKFR